MPASASGIRIMIIARESFVVVLPNKHHLAAGLDLQPADLGDEPLLTLARRAAPGFCDALLGALLKLGLVLTSALELDELHTMVSLSASELGLAIVPEGVAASLPPGVTTRPLQLGMHRSEIGLAWKEKTSPVAKAFYRVCWQHRAYFLAN